MADMVQDWRQLRRSVLASLLAVVAAEAAGDRLPDEWRKHQHTVAGAAEEHYRGDRAAFLAAIIHVESRWQRHAVSPAGAEGMAQIMPETREHIEEIEPGIAPIDPFHPVQAADAAAVYLDWLEGLLRPHAPTDEDLRALVASAYNGGIGNLSREADAAGSWRWDDIATVTRRDYAAWEENRAYVIRVLDLEKRYREAW